MLIFHDAIRFVYKGGEEILFKSFVSRDTCYSLILTNLMASRLQQMQSDKSTFCDKSNI